MNYTAGSISDVGTRRKSNQDSFCYELAEYRGKQLAFLAICDGMGGYSKGEMASAEVLTAFDEWFLERMPELLRSEFSPEVLQDEWLSLAGTENRRLSAYAAKQGLKMGTTLTAALFWEERYYIIHVGDCRLYELREGHVCQLTHDHTVVQREIDRGELTQEEAKLDSRQHILIQCLGAGREITPDFTVGTIRPGSSYLLCSDGFRHQISPAELWQRLNPDDNPDQKTIEQNLFLAVETVKERGETDNITAGLLVVR